VTFKTDVAIASIVVLILTTSCSTKTLTLQEHEDLESTTVVFNKFGQPLDPKLEHDEPYPASNGYKLHLQKIEKNIDRHFETRCGKEHEKKIAVFIHGGLNKTEDALQRAKIHGNAMRDDCIYPIFVSWKSSLWSSWGDHIFNIREGEYDDRILSKAEFPIVFLADAIDSLLRLPKDMANAFKLAFTRAKETKLRTSFNTCKSKLSKENDSDITETSEIDGIRDCKPVKDVDGYIPPDTYARDGSEALWRAVYRSPSFASNAIGLPLVNTFGKSSWQVMEGRIQRLFQEKYRDDNRSPIIMLMDAIKKAATGDVEVTVIGHSMGAIIVNGILREMPDFAIDNIVYMAAASSLKDFEESVYPYMKNNDPRVFHLVLDPDIERHEVNFYQGFIPGPQGSLLLWIDDYLSESEAMLDKTSGRYDNLVPYLQRSNRVENRNMKLVVFAAGKELREYNPRKHGDFSNFPYWKPEFYDQENRSAVVGRLCFNAMVQC